MGWIRQRGREDGELQVQGERTVEVGVLKRWFLRRSSGPGARAQSQVTS